MKHRTGCIYNVDGKLWEETETGTQAVFFQTQRINRAPATSSGIPLADQIKGTMFEEIAPDNQEELFNQSKEQQP